MTNAEICHSKETPFKYGDYALSDGETFRIGRLKIETVHTPGHTIDSMCFAVYDGEANDKPLMRARASYSVIPLPHPNRPAMEPPV